MSRFLIRQVGRFQNALSSHNVPGLQWLLEGFNFYDKERVKEVGPDRAAAEWIVRCDGKIRFDRIDEAFDDYNALVRRTAELDPRKVEDQVKLVEIDATGSSITAYGCRHFKNLEKIKDVQLINCKSLHDFGLEYIGDEVGDRLLYLQIENCPRITEFGLEHLVKFTGLKSLVLKDLRRVHDQDKVLEQIKRALPNCDVYAHI
ncbi:hypothetical protein L596_012307 [Steinernema carpocapsae]|uniref:Uncharacterized protein n=1 Tax=Steinernema carpocapsae TaxID=34508 RepID=A0A4V6A4R3_STECR|nr:hypothetical protein L596_012307 [Steinernema carpocapsae]